MPVETVIKHRQSEYYRLLGVADQETDCTPFVEFLLDSILDSLKEAVSSESKTRVETRVEIKEKIPDKILTLLKKHPKLTLAELAVQLEKSTSTIERAVAKLKQDGKVEFIGAKKDGVWKVVD